VGPDFRNKACSTCAATFAEGGEIRVLKLFTFAQTFAMEKFASLREREEGQTMAEYAVVLAVITLVVIGAIQLLGGNISTAVNKVAGYIK
jgi:Flp pilus assembly pilin Flp